MKSFLIAPLALILTTASVSRAANTELAVQTKADGRPGVDLSIEYTLGVHEGYASVLNGRALVDFENSSVSSAEFQVPISSMTTGSAKRDCHMRESLGLDYAISSFPEKHVCLGDNSLPATGVDSVIYPEIIFELRGLNAADGTPLTRIDAGAESSVLAVGSFSVHGVRKDQIVAVKLTRSIDERGKSRLRVRGRFNLSLKDFGVEVIAWAGLISVKDTAKVKLDLDLADLSP
jgi:polyisoprenoid-binding protein YceI